VLFPNYVNLYRITPRLLRIKRFCGQHFVSKLITKEFYLQQSQSHLIVCVSSQENEQSRLHCLVNLEPSFVATTDCGRYVRLPFMGRYAITIYRSLPLYFLLHFETPLFCHFFISNISEYVFITIYTYLCVYFSNRSCAWLPLQ
jgi:hypothetical protein